MDPVPTSLKNRDLLLGTILVAIILLAYLPVWQAGFIWDDDINLTENPCIIGPLGLKEIWTTSAAQFYPLVLTTLWLEHALWGLQPLPYHLVNVILHAACALALWRVLRKLLVPGAWLGAALWALHPVQAESVAWISELKNTQSGLFYLLSILFFIRHLRSQNERDPTRWDWDYALTVIFAALAITSKSSTVILPLVLCLCAWWREGRWHWRNLTKVVPIIPMSLAAGALTLWTQVLTRGAHPVSDPRRHTWLAHMVSAGEGFWFYLGKLVWPHPLIALYPQLDLRTGEPLSYLPFLVMGIVLVILWQKRKSWARPWFFAFAYFLVAMLPELEFAGWYLGDHFQYLGSMGPLVLVGAGIMSIRERILKIALGVILTTFFAILTLQQAYIDRNSKTLWTYTLFWNDMAWIAHNSLGSVLLDEGHYDRAVAEFQKAQALCPIFVGARTNLGLAYLRMGKLDAAENQFRQAIKLDSTDSLAMNDLGDDLMQKGRTPDAIAAFRQAVAQKPDFAKYRFNLGNAFQQAGRFDEAATAYRKAVEIDPNYADAYNGLGIALAQQRDYAGAAEQFRAALRIEPGLETAKKNLAQAEEILSKKPKP